MKRSLIALLSLICLVSFIAGCAGDSKTEKTEDTKTIVEESKHDEQTGKDDNTDVEEDAYYGVGIKSALYKEGGGNKIGITVIDNVIPHCQAFVNGATEVIEANGDIPVVLDPGFDAVIQAQNIDDFVAQGCVGIVCETIDGKALITSVQNAVDSGVMVSSADFPFAEGYEHLVCSQVMTPNFDSAQALGEKMAEDIGYEGNIVILCRPDAGSQARADGYRSVVEKYDLNVIFDGDGGGEVEKANTVMQDILQANEKIDAVVCSNDEQAIGAYTAAETAGRADEVKCYGFDAAPEAVEFIKAGKEAASLGQNPYSMAKQSALDLYKAMNGEDVGAKIKNVPYSIVTIENADERVDTYYTGDPDVEYE